MKKIFPILILPFLVASCYEEILIPTEDKDPVLVMNAQMSNLETVHNVFLSVSRLSQVDPLPGATVKVYINGVLAAEAVERIDGDPWNTTAYQFDNVLHPGDEVRIEARKDAFYAYATAMVPPAVAVEALDTSSVRMKFMDEVTDYVQLKVRFQDLPGDSWYGVDHRISDIWEYLDEAGNPVPEYTARWESRGGIDTDYDPVISEGTGSAAGNDLGALLSATNYFHCFADTPIADQESTLRVMIYPMYLYLPEYRYGITMPAALEEVDNIYETLMKMPARVHRNCYFLLRSLDFSQYHYLKALNTLETFGTEVSFLVEPTTLPSNVEGGLGFVGIETVTEYPYATFDREYGPEDTIYY